MYIDTAAHMLCTKLLSVFHHIFLTGNKPHKVCSECHEHIHIRCKKCPKCQAPCAIGQSQFRVEENDLHPKSPREMFQRLSHKVKCSVITLQMGMYYVL